LDGNAAWDNFVLSTGCDVPPHTPIENIRAFYEALGGVKTTAMGVSSDPPVTAAEIFQTRFGPKACLVCEIIASQTRWKAFSCLNF